MKPCFKKKRKYMFQAKQIKYLLVLVYTPYVLDSKFVLIMWPLIKGTERIWEYPESAFL